MARIVASETRRRVSRTESSSATPGPPIPGGLMHAMGRHADTTACGLTVRGLHVWPELSFPRRYGQHCAECLSTDLLLDLTAAEHVGGQLGRHGEAPAAAQL